MPLCVFDIASDGTATVPTDAALTGSGAYRWWHYDLNDADLATWSAQNLPAIPAGALLQPETRPRCDNYGDGLMLNLRGINMNDGQQADQMVSVRMWVAQDVIVTVRVRRIFALDDIRQDTLKGDAPRSTASFLQTLITKLTGRIQDEVLALGKLVEFYEDDLEDLETTTPPDLQASRRSVIKLRRYLAPQQSAVTKLAQSDLSMIGPQDALHLRELANLTTIAVEELNALNDRIVTVQYEHDLYIAQRQASHGHRLSIAAGIFLPLGFLTGLFGVNIAGMPGLKDPWAFAWLCAGLAILGAMLLFLLKRKRWL